MDEFDHIFSGSARLRSRSFPAIACLYTGHGLPPNCAPMPLSPSPDVGMRLDERYSDLLAAALAQNPAVHDGAVMIGRSSIEERYCLTGWSYRLFPPATERGIEVNRGSAFNSCLAMSTVSNVDRLYLTSGDSFLRFERGQICRF